MLTVVGVVLDQLDLRPQLLRLRLRRVTDLFQALIERLLHVPQRRVDAGTALLGRRLVRRHRPLQLELLGVVLLLALDLGHRGLEGLLHGRVCRRLRCLRLHHLRRLLHQPSQQLRDLLHVALRDVRCHDG